MVVGFQAYRGAPGDLHCCSGLGWDGVNVQLCGRSLVEDMGLAGVVHPLVLGAYCLDGKAGSGADIAQPNTCFPHTLHGCYKIGDIVGGRAKEDEGEIKGFTVRVGALPGGGRNNAVEMRDYTPSGGCGGLEHGGVDAPALEQADAVIPFGHGSDHLLESPAKGSPKGRALKFRQHGVFLKNSVEVVLSDEHLSLLGTGYAGWIRRFLRATSPHYFFLHSMGSMETVATGDGCHHCRCRSVLAGNIGWNQRRL